MTIGNVGSVLERLREAAKLGSAARQHDLVIGCLSCAPTK